MTPQEQIELHLLHVLVEDTPDYYEYCYYFPFKYLMRATQYDREIVRGFMRSMRDRRLVEYGCGFNDDGETAGGGYTLTPAGKTHHRNLREKMRAGQIAARDMVSRGDAASWGSTSYS